MLLLLLTDAILTQAAAALDGGRPADARVVLERTVQQTPAKWEAWALLARAYWMLQEREKAAAAAQRADRPTLPPDAQHALALYYAQSGNRKRAAQLEGQFALSPQADAAAAARAALLSFEVGDVDSAIRFGERADQTQVRAEVVLMLARAWESRRDWDRALSRYEQWAQLQPASEDARFQAGQAYLRAGRFAQAVPFLEQSVQQFGTSAQLQLALGVAYYGQRRFPDAGARFLRTIDLAPDTEQPYVFLAKMIDQLEPLWPALEPVFRQWYGREPRSHLPPFVLAKLLLARADSDAAEPLLRESIARHGKFWEAHFELGGILERRRQWAAAAQEYEAAVQGDARQAEPHYRLARVYARLNQPAKAAAARAQHEKLAAAAPASGMAERK